VYSQEHAVILRGGVAAHLNNLDPQQDVKQRLGHDEAANPGSHDGVGVVCTGRVHPVYSGSGAIEWRAPYKGRLLPTRKMTREATV